MSTQLDQTAVILVLQDMLVTLQQLQSVRLVPFLLVVKHLVLHALQENITQRNVSHLVKTVHQALNVQPLLQLHVLPVLSLLVDKRRVQLVLLVNINQVQVRLPVFPVPEITSVLCPPPPSVLLVKPQLRALIRALPVAKERIALVASSMVVLTALLDHLPLVQAPPCVKSVLRDISAPTVHLK